MKRKVLVCDWPTTLHPYTLTGKRHANHPVHMIEGGQYLTEDMSPLGDPNGDMGEFGLNAKDYAWFKAHVQEVELEAR